MNATEWWELITAVYKDACNNTSRREMFLAIAEQLKIINDADIQIARIMRDFNT